MADLLGIAIEPKLLDGVWWDITDALQRVGHAYPCTDRNQPTPGRACVLLVPMGEDYRRAVHDLQRPHLLTIRANKGVVPPEVFDAVRPHALARAVLRGWSGLTLGGSEVPYSQEKAIEILSDKRLELFTRLIENCASNDAALLAQEEEQAQGN